MEIAEALGADPVELCDFLDSVKPVSKADKKLAVGINARRLYEGGMSFAAVSEEVGLSDSTLKKLAITDGWNVRPSAPQITWDTEKGKQMYYEGASCQKIADACGATSKKSVSSYAAKHQWRRKEGFYLTGLDLPGKYETAKQMYEEGKGLSSIRKAISVPEEKIQEVADRDGWVRPEAQPTAMELVNKEELLALWNAGVSISELGRKFDIPYSTMRKYCCAKLPPRPDTQPIPKKAETAKKKEKSAFERKYGMTEAALKRFDPDCCYILNLVGVTVERLAERYSVPVEKVVRAIEQWPKKIFFKSTL